MTPSEAFRANNPIPQKFMTLEELWEWHKPLIDAGKANKNKKSKGIHKPTKKRSKNKKRTNRQIVEYWLKNIESNCK